ncbi:AsmA-like C-terminal region-containing protein [Aquabacter spiritensis]|uniref:AsmA-like protein n=1 Tax=Aquabacter spiritensis TaxID=933073 RepID=A0A4R3M168_9HYPH|nr:AsmA-like C-terminal region-containing protein [Aquabacter spiritensis]TCT06844.1 AsmA-like protein [Aquabacter spiritensis]
MQGILITIATAVIAVIVAAFATPYVVDWNAWRATFESEASRTLGVPVLIRGPIQAELLPVPRLTLRAVTIGADGVSTGGSVERLDAEFSLGAMMRGNLEARGVTLVRPRLRAVLDSAGRIAAPTGAGVPIGLAIDRLTIRDGAIDLLDRGADRTLRLTRLDLEGEARSLSGPFRLDGSGEAGGRSYGLRVSLGRIGEEPSRLRLIAEAHDRPVMLDFDGTFRMERGTPRFSGHASLVRRGDATTGGAWRIGANLRADPEALVAENLELSLGDEARPAQLAGSARLSLGRAIALDAVLNARALDADALFPTAATAARTPSDALAGLAAAFAALPTPEFRARIGAAVEQLTVGGTVVRDARLDLTGGTDGWHVDNAEARLPGQTTLRLSGTPARADGGGTFEGDLTFASDEPTVFLRWAAPRAKPELAAALSGPVRLSGRVVARDDLISADAVKLSIGDARASGSGALRYGPPPRLDVALTLDGFDLDPVIAAARPLIQGTDGAIEGGIKLEGRRLRLSGLPLGALSLAAVGRDNAWILTRLSIADLAGLALDGSGRFERLADPLRGTLDLTVAGARADGLVPIVRLIAGAAAADTLAGLLPIAAPVKLASTAAWTEAGGASLSAEGTLGLVSGRAAFARAKAGALDRVDLALAASDAARVLEAAGLPGLKPGQGPGRLDLTLRPEPGGGAAFDGRLILADASASGAGKVALSQDGQVLPRLKGEIRSTDLSRVIASLAAMETGPVPASLAFDLSRVDGRWHFAGLAGSLAGGTLTGAVTLDPAPQPRLSGTLAVEAISLPRLIGLWGARSTGADAGTGIWPAARFSGGAPLPLALALDLSARRIDLSGAYALSDGRVRLAADAQSLEMRDIAGGFGGGQFSGAMTLRRRPDGLAADGRIALADVAAAALLAPLAPRTPPAGRITLSLDLLGSGRSPQTLVQSLSGQGTLGVAGLEIQNADPRALDVVLAETTTGQPPDERRTAQMFDRALHRGPLRLELVETAFGVVNGAIRLSPGRAQVGPVRATFNGTLDPVRLLMEASLELEASEAGGATPGGSILWQGPLAAPERRVTAAPLATAIAMRAIDRETRLLEERRTLGVDTGAGGTPPAGNPTAPSTQQRPAGGTPAAALPPTPPARAPEPARVPDPPRASEPAARPTQPQRSPETRAPEPRQPAPASAQAPPLAPPVDIGPGVRPRAVRPDPDSAPYRPPAGFGTIPRPPGLVPGE